MTNILFSFILAATIYGEASTEQGIGKDYVAAVAYNRARGMPGVPLASAISAVCLKKHQFSCWNKPFKIDYESKAWFDSVEAALPVLQPGYKPVTKATHYHHVGVRPRWSKKLRRLAIVGNHAFYE